MFSCLLDAFCDLEYFLQIKCVVVSHNDVLTSFVGIAKIVFEMTVCHADGSFVEDLLRIKSHHMMSANLEKRRPAPSSMENSSCPSFFSAIRRMMLTNQLFKNASSANKVRYHYRTFHTNLYYS